MIFSCVEMYALPIKTIHDHMSYFADKKANGYKSTYGNGGHFICGLTTASR